jgi:SdpC family antimicrobial peptide
VRTTTPRTRSAILLGVAVSATAALIGAQAAYADTTQPESVSVVSANEQSGEDLFRAIVFGDLDRTPELHGQLPELAQTAEAQKVIERIVTEIDSTNPEFFDEFADDLQSGNVHKVESGLDDAAVVMADSLIDLGYATDEDLVSPQWAAITVVLFAAAAVVVGGAAVLTVTAVSTVNVFWGAAATGDSSLEQEKQIATLTERLG